MFDRLNNYINDDNFELTITDKYIHIKNYQRLISLENNFISFTTTSKKLNIKGINFTPNKLLDNEIVIKGEIKYIEVINEK